MTDWARFADQFETEYMPGMAVFCREMARISTVVEPPAASLHEDDPWQSSFFCWGPQLPIIFAALSPLKGKRLASISSPEQMRGLERGLTFVEVIGHTHVLTPSWIHAAQISGGWVVMRIDDTYARVKACQ